MHRSVLYISTCTRDCSIKPAIQAVQLAQRFLYNHGEIIIICHYYSKKNHRRILFYVPLSILWIICRHWRILLNLFYIGGRKFDTLVIAPSWAIFIFYVDSYATFCPSSSSLNCLLCIPSCFDIDTLEASTKFWLSARGFLNARRSYAS